VSTTTSLLSRYAEAIFWMARYVERAENLARILDVHESFARDSRGGHDWTSIVDLYVSKDAFVARHEAATPEAALHFMVLDDTHPGSLVSIVKAARENARVLRPLISTEMWINLNTFYNRVRALRPDDVAEERLARTCQTVKESCQTHTGITEGTFYRDEGWYFYQIGRLLERADQTTRLLDVKYHLLLPSLEDVGTPLDISQWNALLRSAAGYHAFRRIQPSGMSPATVSHFLLFNPFFPRSLCACVESLDETLMRLRSFYGLKGGAAALELLDEMRAVLRDNTIETIMQRGLHEFLDWTQVRLIDVAGALGQDFFGYARVADQSETAA
jgi:uncharacterized alpha-E superfamily protein